MEYRSLFLKNSSDSTWTPLPALLAITRWCGGEHPLDRRDFTANLPVCRDRRGAHDSQATDKIHLLLRVRDTDKIRPEMVGSVYLEISAEEWDLCRHSSCRWLIYTMYYIKAQISCKYEVLNSLYDSTGGPWLRLLQRSSQTSPREMMLVVRPIMPTLKTQYLLRSVSQHTGLTNSSSVI